jgi:hypothetical protein
MFTPGAVWSGNVGGFISVAVQFMLHQNKFFAHV